MGIILLKISSVTLEDHPIYNIGFPRITVDQRGKPAIAPEIFTYQIFSAIGVDPVWITPNFGDLDFCGSPQKPEFASDPW